MDCLVYRPQRVSQQIRWAADDAALSCGYDQFEEELLHSEILKIRWLDVDSVKKHFSEFLERPRRFAPNRVVRVDWQTWAIKTRFDGQYQDAVIERVESIVIDVPTLLDGGSFPMSWGPNTTGSHGKNNRRLARSPRTQSSMHCRS